MRTSSIFHHCQGPASPPTVHASHLLSLPSPAPPPPPTPDLNPTVTGPAITSAEKHQWQLRRSGSRESGPVDQFVIFLVAAKGAHALNSWHGSSTVECLGLNYSSRALGGGEALGACESSPAQASMVVGSSGGLMMISVLNTLP